VFWSNNPIHVISNIQSIVTIGTAVPDNITAFARMNASTGSLRIEKTVQGGGSAAGFEFEVRNAAGDLIGTFTSGANGVVTSIVIPQMPENLEFLFDLSLGGLVAVPQEDGSIFFFVAADVVNVLTIERPAIVVENPAEEPQETPQEEAESEEIAEEDSAYYTSPPRQRYP